jgi:hypothetical protein
LEGKKDIQAVQILMSALCIRLVLDSDRLLLFLCLRLRHPRWVAIQYVLVVAGDLILRLRGLTSEA